MRNFTFAMITLSFTAMTSGVNDIMCVEKWHVAKRRVMVSEAEK